MLSALEPLDRVLGKPPRPVLEEPSKEEPAQPETDNSNEQPVEEIVNGGDQAAALESDQSGQSEPSAPDATSPECEELRKKADHFEKKFNAYEKKGNKRKSRAYAAKLEKAEQKLQEAGCR